MSESEAVRALLLLVACCVLPVQLTGQVRPIQLDTIRVEVSSRTPATAGASSRAIDIITADEIRRLPASTVTEVLRYAFGVDLMPRSAALVDVGIRGSSFEQVLVLVDGSRMRDAQTGHFNLNLALPLDQVDRIEVLRGAGSSLYGSDAMAGVINIVTRRRGQGSAATAARGSFATNELSLSHRRPFGSVDADIGLEYQKSDGHRPGTDYEVAAARFAAAYPLGDRPIEMDVAFASRDFGAAHFYGDYPAFESTSTTTASLRWGARRGSVELAPSVTYRRNADDFILYRDDPDIYRNIHTTHQIGGEFIGRVELTEGVSAAAGVHGIHDRIRSAALGDRDEWTGAASLEIAAARGDLAVGSAGIRADRRDSNGLEVSPSFSAAWSPTTGIRLRSSAGRSFRSPTWTERYYRDPQNIGNPDLDPERAWSADLGIDLDVFSSFRIALTAFIRDAEDLIDWARPSENVEWVTRNVDSATFRGLETEFSQADLLGARVVARGAWISLRSSSEAGFASKYALRPLLDRASLSVDREAFGPIDLGFTAGRDRRVGENAYFLLDARSSIELGSVRLRLDLKNALDEGYVDIGEQPAAGRSLMLGLEWRSGV